MGCPIRGVILDPIVAMQMGIQGQVYYYFRIHVCEMLKKDIFAVRLTKSVGWRLCCCCLIKEIPSIELNGRKGFMFVNLL